ncbi:MAG: LacI family DNA-binding transcriptional regulator [Caldilineaceae bacterium]|nr:LacI family DNA-binding transcriptional regulator [Caldilineaceae bacterium]
MADVAKLAGVSIATVRAGSSTAPAKPTRRL